MQAATAAMGAAAVTEHTVLGLESSCDETAAAVVRLGADGRAEVLSSVVASQLEAHAPYGGVVPEIAARAHVDVLDSVMAQTLREAGVEFGGLTGVAATAGPGLIGGVMVGLVAGKAVALARGLPLVAVNHLEGHALSPRLEADVPFPYLLLLVSGGHTQLLAVEGLGRARRLGTTIDDAAGEAFDKTAKVLGLGYPGGPAVERAARAGDPARFALPRPLLGRPGADFSFAGLKTAVLREAQLLRAPDGTIAEQDVADLCASFQAAVGDVLENRVRQAMCDPACAGAQRFVVAGGVAANLVLRARLEGLCAREGFSFFAPALKYCGDNAAMIALAGAERLAAGICDTLEAPARPRWPLDELAAHTAPAFLRPGRKGAKA
jgi:N6-L-threonylcarbamoyladenine synthase